MSNRRQYVKVNAINSHHQPIKRGVPQDSMFFIYINDICNFTNKSKITLFADDTNVFIEINNLALLTSEAESILDAKRNWINPNTLNLNSSKSYVCILGHNRCSSSTGKKI